MTWVPDWSTGDDLYEEIADEQEVADLEHTEQGFEQGYAPAAWEAELDAGIAAYEARTQQEALDGTASWQWSDHGRYESDNEDGDGA